MLFSSAQFSGSVVSDSATPWIAAHQASLSITISRIPLKLTSIDLVMPSSHLILCRPLFLLPPAPPNIRVFSNESPLRMRCPKYWSFSFSIIPSKEHPGLISFRMDWLDLLAVQGTLKSLLQHHSSKASLLRCSAFFTVQLSHPYMTIGKTIALTRRTFVRKLQIKTSMRYHHILIRMAKSQNTDNTKFKIYCTTKGTHLLLMEYKMVYPVGKTVWQLAIKLNVLLPSQSNNPALRYLPKEFKT